MLNRKTFKVLIGCGALLLTLSSCSSVEHIAGLLGLRHTNEAAEREENYATFARTARPVQGNPEAHYCLARYYQDRGKHRAALAELEKTIAIDPASAKAFSAMGVSYDYLKEFGRASECYHAALRLDPNAADVYNNMGQSLLVQGNYISAAEAFKKAAALDGASPRIHNNLGRAYAMAGRYDLAIEEFEQAGKGVSAESTLAGVLHEAERQPPSEETTATAAEDGTKRFVARVAGFLQQRSAGETSREANMAAEAPQTGGIPAGVCVEVSNGNGINHMARDVGDYLRKKGFRVSRVTNAGKFDVVGTCIYYEKDQAQAANLLAGQVPVVKKKEEVARLDVRQIKVKLLLGADMIRYKKKFTEGRS